MVANTKDDDKKDVYENGVSFLYLVHPHKSFHKSYSRTKISSDLFLKMPVN